MGKIDPSRNKFASIVDCKRSGDELAVKRLANLFRKNGVTKMVYKTDQENAAKAFVDDSMGQAGDSILVDDDAILEAVPEYSAVGESASNGKAELTFRMIEDRVRTLTSALEARINARVSAQHPAMRWLVRHAALILNRFSVNPDGQTPDTSWKTRFGQMCGVLGKSLLLCAKEDEVRIGFAVATWYMRRSQQRYERVRCCSIKWQCREGSLCGASDRVPAMVCRLRREDRWHSRRHDRKW